MKNKPVEEILDRLERRSQGRASPGSAIGREPSWERTPFTVLVATVLSQRTRDEDTWSASESLFARFSTPLHLMEATEESVDALIRSVNYHRGKAKAIKEIARVIHERFGDQVPSNLEDLMTLPMVGRKTANCVQVYAFNLEAICVDTHVHRISNRIGLVHSKDPEDTEEQLMRIVPRSRWRSVNELMVRFGQEVCTPVRPKHEQCPLQEFCDAYQNLGHKGGG